MRVEHFPRQDVPPGVVPVEMLSPKDLIALGLDPVEVYRMQDELADMGLGLGISLKGLVRGVGRGIKGAAKGVFKGAKFVAKTAVKAAPIVLPVAAGGFLAVKYGPGVVSRVARLFKKKPSQVTEADMQRAGATPAVTPSVVEEVATRLTLPDIAAREQPKGDEKSLFDKALELVTRIGPAVPQVVAAAEQVKEVVAPTPAVAPQVTVTVPEGGGVQQAGVAAGGGMPGWLPLAAGLAALALFRR